MTWRKGSKTGIIAERKSKTAIKGKDIYRQNGRYGVASVGRINKITGLFCKRAL